MAKADTFDVKELLTSKFQETTPTDILRVSGALVGGFGAYMLTRTIQKQLGSLFTAQAWQGTGVGALFVDFMTGITPLGWVPGMGDALKLGYGGLAERIGGPAKDEVLLAPDPFAISVGIVTIGYLLAGQNPAEILKGIGELIPL